MDFVLFERFSENIQLKKQLKKEGRIASFNNNILFNKWVHINNLYFWELIVFICSAERENKK